MITEPDCFPIELLEKYLKEKGIKFTQDEKGFYIDFKGDGKITFIAKYNTQATQ